MSEQKAILKSDDGLSQLVRCPQCRYLVFISDVIWKRQPLDVNDDGEIERCRFDQPTEVQ